MTGNRLEHMIGLLNPRDRSQVEAMVEELVDSYYRTGYDALTLEQAGLDDRYVKLYWKQARIGTVGQVRKLSEQAVMGIRNIGPDGLLKTKRMLGRLGIALLGSEVEKLPDTDVLREQPIGYLWTLRSKYASEVHTLGELADKFDELHIPVSEKSRLYSKLHFYGLK
ncbi:hypothetical protein HYU11_05730 [Candidatus Woesearchaeota archaeon]|nr:hypothetical protein [Candidatus Woesearchaeota archaeon]